PRLGMAFTSNANEVGETLYVASQQGGLQEPLGVLDTKTFHIDAVGTMVSKVGSSELTGNAKGELYAFSPLYFDVDLPGFDLAQVDPHTAAVLSEITLDLTPQPTHIHAWAFAYWGGDFYFFTT